MSASATDQPKSFVPEATAENGRSYVRPSRATENFKPRFEPKTTVWLRDDAGDRPPREVVIESRHDEPGGMYTYELTYKSTGQVVKDPKGKDRFPEDLLSISRPVYF